VISIFMDRIGRGQPITIFGDGGQTRDFVYVADVVRALIAGMTHREIEPRVINVCTGRTTSVLALAHTVGEVWGVKPEIGFGPPRSGEIRSSLGDPARARSALGFEAGTLLRDGLAGMVRATR
jgi:UDP-glucose 4-epimerase